MVDDWVSHETDAVDEGLEERLGEDVELGLGDRLPDGAALSKLVEVSDWAELE